MYLLRISSNADIGFRLGYNDFGRKVWPACLSLAPLLLPDTRNNNEHRISILGTDAAARGRARGASVCGH